MRDVYCEIYTLNGFSAHADQKDLVEFARQTQEHGKVKAIVLVHGDEHPKQVLKALLEKEKITNWVITAEPGLRIDL
jgi:metallo-beta-lactamase family protein